MVHISSMMKTEVESLLAKFRNEFNKEPDVCVVVPGRVNIIGEHVDYSGFPVLPMALQRSIIVLGAKIKKSGDSLLLRMVNSDSQRTPVSKCFNSSIEIDYGRDGWCSYFVCGVKGALECREISKCADMEVMVSGSVPAGAGLSSSSALVCAAFLVTACLNKIEISMVDAAVKCATCERYIGTEGGGMDQAIALLASPGCAKLVEFEPVLKASNVCLPNDAVFVVAHSQVTKNKAADSEFNTRVVECRLASQIIAKTYGIEWKGIRKLKTVLNHVGVSINEAPTLINKVFTQASYTKAEVCKLLDVSEDELNNTSLSHNTKHVGEFKLKQRALHVYEEAQRVYDWRKAAEANDLDQMGKLMNDSHASLRDLYECSEASVDSLVGCCLDAGALGARITGAGWGGCVVALTTKKDVETFIAKVKKSFYCDSGECDDLIFPTSPGSGAAIFKPPFNF